MNEQSDNTREKNLREAEKQIVRSAFLALAALAVIVFACYAWFVSSGTVTGKVGAVRIDGSSFELGSVGSSGKWDARLGDRAEEGAKQTIDGLELFVTGEKSDIFWKMTSENDLNNTNEKTGISPGDRGTLEFYVIPKKAGSLNLKFSLRLLPLNEDVEQIINLESLGGDPTLTRLMLGHFLFYQINDGNQSLLNYEQNSFTKELTIEDDAVDKPILFTVGWRWPKFLRDVIDEDTDGSTIRAWMTAKPEDFFYLEENGQSVPISSPNLDKSDPNFNETFRKYNSYFNNADEYIGTLVKSVILQLEVEEI